MSIEEPFLTREQAAVALSAHGYKISRATLATLATRGGGPVFRKWGASVLYKLSDLLAWADARTTKKDCIEAVPESDEWHEYKGERYRVAYDSGKVIVVSDAFQILELQVVPDGTLHVVMKLRAT